LFSPRLLHLPSLVRRRPLSVPSASQPEPCKVHLIVINVAKDRLFSRARFFASSLNSFRPFVAEFLLSSFDYGIRIPAGPVKDFSLIVARTVSSLLSSPAHRSDLFLAFELLRLLAVFSSHPISLIANLPSLLVQLTPPPMLKPPFLSPCSP